MIFRAVCVLSVLLSVLLVFFAIIAINVFQWLSQVSPFATPLLFNTVLAILFYFIFLGFLDTPYNYEKHFRKYYLFLVISTYVLAYLTDVKIGIPFLDFGLVN